MKSGLISLFALLALVAIVSGSKVEKKDEVVVPKVLHSLNVMRNQMAEIKTRAERLNSLQAVLKMHAEYCEDYCKSSCHAYGCLGCC